MMVLPSKELLSTVLGEECLPLEIVGNTLYYKVSYSENTLLEINIYELMHMMKEWAFEKGFMISSVKFLLNNKYGSIVQTKDTRYFVAESYSEHEHEVVTKACEWILEQQK